MFIYTRVAGPWVQVRVTQVKLGSMLGMTRYDINPFCTRDCYGCRCVVPFYKHIHVIDIKVGMPLRKFMCEPLQQIQVVSKM
jgi:hypothetical protein